MDEFLKNFLLGVMLAAPIGPAGVAVIQTGLRRGFRRAFWTGLGITSADLTYMLVVYFGLAGVIAVPMVKIAIWTMGALVLFYLGYLSVRDSRRKIDFERGQSALHPQSVPGGLPDQYLQSDRGGVLVGDFRLADRGERGSFWYRRAAPRVEHPGRDPGLAHQHGDPDPLGPALRQRKERPDHLDRGRVCADRVWAALWLLCA